MPILVGLVLGVIVAEPIVFLTHASEAAGFLIGMVCGSLGVLTAAWWTT